MKGYRMSELNKLLQSALEAAAEVVAQRGGREAVIMETMSAVAKYNANRRASRDQIEKLLGTASRGDPGSVELLWREYLLSSEGEYHENEASMRRQGLPDSYISQAQAMKRQQLNSEYAQFLSNLQMMRHQTAMGMINNIR